MISAGEKGGAGSVLEARFGPATRLARLHSEPGRLPS